MNWIARRSNRARNPLPSAPTRLIGVNAVVGQDSDPVLQLDRIGILSYSRESWSTTRQAAGLPLQVGKLHWGTAPAWAYTSEPGRNTIVPARFFLQHAEPRRADILVCQQT